MRSSSAQPISVRFREDVRPADCRSVERIVSSTGFFSAAETVVAVELVQERLSRGLSSGYYFLFADEGDETPGYACFGPIPCTVSSWDLYWIVVRDDAQKQGLGRELLGRSEASIARHGGTRIYVETSSRDQYVPTRSFYESCGYWKEAVIADFYSPGDHKVIYLKIIDAKA